MGVRGGGTLESGIGHLRKHLLHPPCKVNRIGEKIITKNNHRVNNFFKFQYGDVINYVH